AARLGSLEAVVEQDVTLAHTFAGEPDLAEGVRALLVDRDNSPVWRHGSLAEVSRDEVEAAFT
ncbi:MAG: enoyl-CoA hydratase/isomerase family protein, partial [Mobilicoccus sp.]|nr:enoyl-CoA hydratase/isomerase family protein [Mobilicoccus sp.]